MYSEADLSDAVASGAVTREAADALRAFSASRGIRSPGESPGPAARGGDPEAVRFVGGFNDVFVAVALAITLIAGHRLVSSVSSGLGLSVVTGASWLLAEYFTRARRMALPSILLMVSFVAPFGILAHELVSDGFRSAPQGVSGLAASAGFLAALAAACAHWARFKVPMGMAAIVLSACASAFALTLSVAPGMVVHSGSAIFTSGAVLLAGAFWWDARDTARATRASDVAFWLHLAAAPLLVHPLFSALGLLSPSAMLFGGLDAWRAAAAIAAYVALGMVSLVIDRRALLVSSLGYVLYALSSLFMGAGSPGMALGAAALCIGSGLLVLSAFWQSVRAPLVRMLPANVRGSVPPAQPMRAASPAGLAGERHS